MKTNYTFLLAFLLTLSSCQPAATGPETSEAEKKVPESQGPAPVDPEKDFILKYDYGIINGSQAPEEVNVDGNSRHFDFGELEVQTEGHASLSGETIRYRRSGDTEWRQIPDEDFIFFIGYDGRQHLIIDQGTGPDNREARLFDIKAGKTAYSGRYNNILIREGWLYMLRYADPARLPALPDCSRRQIPPDQLAYEEPIAVNLSTFAEQKTGQVFCVYRQ